MFRFRNARNHKNRTMRRLRRVLLKPHVRSFASAADIFRGDNASDILYSSDSAPTFRVPRLTSLQIRHMEMKRRDRLRSRLFSFLHSIHKQ